MLLGCPAHTRHTWRSIVVAEKAPLQNAWREYIQEGRLLGNESRKQVETFVRRLVKEGELRTDQVQQAIDEIQRRSKKSVDELQKRIRQQLKDELNRIGVATKGDIDKLERRIDKLARQVSAAGGKAPARKPAAKKSTTGASGAKPAAKRAASGSSARSSRTGTSRAGSKST